MSRRHARLELIGDTLTVEDLDSANGTMVNGKRISKKETLYPGDTLQFQEIEFRVSETYNRVQSEPSSSGLGAPEPKYFFPIGAPRTEMCHSVQNAR